MDGSSWEWGTGEQSWKAKLGLCSHPTSRGLCPRVGNKQYKGYGKGMPKEGHQDQGLESDRYGFKARLWHFLAV